MRHAAIVAACSLAGLVPASCSGGGPQEAGPDDRQGIALDREQAHYLRGQMHELLGALQGISEGLATDDLGHAGAAAAAVAQGGEHPEGFHDALPDGFRAMSRQNRANFRAIATMAEAGASDGDILLKLGETMAVCNSCHGVYRVEEGR